jgi:4-amino-4-deoxy-L-arabinose transferase-like glycosyltransferase
MNWLRNNKNLWIAMAAIFALASILAAIDGTRNWLPGWLAYTVIGGVGGTSLWVAWHFTGRDRSMGKIALAAVFLRLAVGVALMLLLPVVGYPDNEPHQEGYYYYDAYIRDQQAWQMAQSGDPLWKPFSGEYSGDQYGGMLALSAGIYRVLSPDAHRPWLILLLTSVAAGWGVLCLGKAAQTWFGERTARLAAWIFALYPEGILLGGTHMREAFVIPAVAMTCLSLAEMRLGKRAWLSWLGLATGLLLIFQPLIAVAALVVLAGAWFFDLQRQRSWKRVLLVAAILVVGLLLVFLVWDSLPSLRGSSPLDWLQKNYEYQTYRMERSSGWIQKLFRTAGPQWQWLIILVYGIAQPVLPAVFGDLNAVWIARITGFFRAVGWYALVPLLLYALLAALRSPSKEHPAPMGRPAPMGHHAPVERRAQLLWLSVVMWAWILIAAYNAGADQWDNPRYRTMMLAWQALLAAWTWGWARQRRDPWLGRWLAVEAFFIVSFVEWYLSRYWWHGLPRLDMWQMVLLNLGAAALILGWDWFRAGLRRVAKK